MPGGTDVVPEEQEEREIEGARVSNFAKECQKILVPSTPESERSQILSTFLYELESKSLMGRNFKRCDFVSIIHQCRKAKWFGQVCLVVDFMRTTRLPDIEPNVFTYAAMLEAKACCPEQVLEVCTYMHELLLIHAYIGISQL